MKSKSRRISPQDGLKIYRFRYPMMGGIIAAAILILAGAMAIPIFFESPSMWYKFGLAKILLRTGKILGMAAVTLLFFQLLLASRLKVLDRTFSLPGLVHIHRFNAIIILLLASIHPILVLTSESKLTVPLEMRYWPEWVGVGLLILILIQFSASQWRVFFRIKYHRWFFLHRCVGTIILGLVILHILFVSETFSEKGFPRDVVLVSSTILFMLWLWSRSGWWRARHIPFSVARVALEGNSSTSIELRPLTDRPFQYFPGQFVFVSFHSLHISREPHPFTLSSTPTRPECLQVTIRACGDWTHNAIRIAEGDRAYLQGPFGRFSHIFTDLGDEIVMIAGGIGITPMLSMLRYMADQHDNREVTLIWSNQTQKNMVYSNEINDLAAKLTGFRQVLIFTRETGKGMSTGRLNHEILQTILQGCSRMSTVFICGPAQMMKQTKADLKFIGFDSRMIHMETFGF